MTGTKRTWGWLVVAAALMIGMTACSTDDHVTDEPKTPPTTTTTATQGVHVTVGAGIGDDGQTRSAVVKDGPTRTLTFTGSVGEPGDANYSPGDRLYIWGDIESNVRRMCGLLTIKSISTDGLSATFDGDLTVKVKDGKTWKDDDTGWAATQSGDPMTWYVTNSLNGVLIPAAMTIDADIYDFKADGGFAFNYEYSLVTGDGDLASKLMTTVLDVKGSYDKTNNRFVLGSKGVIFNCTFSGLAKNTEYKVRYGRDDYGGNYIDFEQAVKTDGDGTARFAISTNIMGDSHEFFLKLSTDDDFSTENPNVLTCSLGNNEFEIKVYNLSRYWTGTEFTKYVDLTGQTGDVIVFDGYTVGGTLSGHQLWIDDGATVTLSGVNITAPENKNYDAILCLGDATIVLADETTNTVSVSVANYGAGIYVPETQTLTIQGNGSLTATGGLVSAGIGSWSKGCGNIIIEGGTIAAYGGSGAAGIGSGNKSNCGNIIIEGGTVTAQGGARAAGIGSGINASCGNISITGGTVTATGGDYAAGIGTGEDGSCGDITIGGTDAGTVTGTATGGENSPSDIGPGKDGSCGTVSVADGTISYVPDANVPCTFNFTFRKNGGNANVWTNEIAVIGLASATITNNGNSIENGSSVTVDLKAMRSGTLTFTASCKNFTAGFTDAGTFTCTLENVRIAKNETNTYDVVMQWAHD